MERTGLQVALDVSNASQTPGGVQDAFPALTDAMDKAEKEGAL
jgi:hypothetical protein